MSWRPSASSRSMAAASRVAASDRAASAAGGAAALGRRGALATAALGDDINVISLLHHLVFAQLHPTVAHELAGPQVVLVAVPRAHEVHLVFGEIHAARGLV